MNLGIIGNGFIVKVLLDTIEGKEEVKVRSICVRSESADKGAELAKKYNIENVYTSLEEFLNADDIDTVYIGIVNTLHYDFAKKAINAGKNVICEKPFTQTLKEAEELYALAEEKGVYLFEAITTLHVPVFSKVKENLHRLGQIRMVNCSFCQYSSRYDRYLEGDYAPVFRKELFGGALVDLNIYNIHFTVAIFGEPKEAQYFPTIGKNGVDTSGVLVLDYGDFKAVCVAAKDSQSESFAIVQGEKGHIKVGTALNNAEHCTVTTKDFWAFFNASESHGRMFYEMREFDRIMKEKDLTAYNEFAKESKLAMKVLEKAYSVMK